MYTQTFMNEMFTRAVNATTSSVCFQLNAPPTAETWAEFEREFERAYDEFPRFDLLIVCNIGISDVGIYLVKMYQMLDRLKPKSKAQIRATAIVVSTNLDGIKRFLTKRPPSTPWQFASSTDEGLRFLERVRNAVPGKRCVTRVRCMEVAMRMMYDSLDRDVES